MRLFFADPKGMLCATEYVARKSLVCNWSGREDLNLRPPGPEFGGRKKPE
jgi:hypothetical protein